MTAKGTATADRADDFQFGLVAFQHVLDYGQTKAGSPCIPRMAGIDTIQPFSQPGDVSGCNAFARVSDAQMSTRIIHLPADAYLGLRRCVPDGIVDQV